MAEPEKKEDAPAEEAEKSEDGAETAEGEEEGKKKGGSKLVLILVLVLVLIGGAGAGAFFFMGQPAEGETAEGATEGEEPMLDENGVPVKLDEEGNPIVAQEVFYEMPEFLVNLQTSASIPRFLKVKVTLELASEEDKLRIEKSMPRIQDSFQAYLRQLRADDLSGSAGVYRLKEALLMRANQSAQPVLVKNVLLTEMLVQ